MIYTEAEINQVKKDIHNLYSYLCPKVVWDLLESVIFYSDERKKILEAVQNHANKQDQDMCWENDVELYNVLGIEYNKDKLPKCKEEHKENCDKYRNGLPFIS
jgi:hypothetical protein